ncbi:MAG: hydroxymethylpyrimidine/phosphomethylpyrimidine kinase [Flavobacteriaceae bacterium]|nr:MAG: hydroxymethylpyrimidine/phosphomethylpyrimidine kinase [Flavobacteriaceae bacterium]
MQEHAYIISIGGLDPSSGAGITSDIKTFEAHGLYGLSVCTAVTIQDDVSFKSCEWVPYKTIKGQLETLLNRFSVPVIKIGIIENWDVLANLLEFIRQHDPNIKIIVDPILKASAGYNFHSEEYLQHFDRVMEYSYLITPNYEEIKALYPEKSIADTLSYMTQKTNIYLKGGHRADQKGWDQLHHSGIIQTNIEPKVDKIHEKHGSGCVLSAALASNLAKGIPLEDACRLAKYYTETFLNSNESLLGTHIELRMNS